MQRRVATKETSAGEVAQEVLAGEDADGLAVVQDEDGVGRLQQLDGRADRLTCTHPGQGGRHVVLDPVGQGRAPGEERLHEVPLDDGPGNLGGHDRRLGTDDGQLRDGVLAQDVDRLGQRLVGVGVYELRQLPPLARRTSPTVWPGDASDRKPYDVSHSSSKTFDR